jgi:hypothetical protein
MLSVQQVVGVSVGYRFHAATAAVHTRLVHLQQQLLLLAVDVVLLCRLIHTQPSRVVGMESDGCRQQHSSLCMQHNCVFGQRNQQVHCCEAVLIGFGYVHDSIGHV